MKRILISLSLFASAFACRAADFTDIIERIVAADVTINAAASRISADSIAALAENNLPDTELSGEMLFRKNDNKFNAGISQSFDWPGLYSARRASAEAEADAARATNEVEREKARLEAASLLTKIAADKCRIAICKRVLDDLNVLATQYRKMLADGNITVIDLNKLLIEIADYTQSMGDTQCDLDDSRAALRTMAPSLDIDAMTADIDDFPALPLGDLNKYIENVLSFSAGIRELNARRTADEANMRVASMSGRPGFSIGYRYSHEDAHSYNGFDMGINLPFFSKRHVSEAARAASDATDIQAAALAETLTAEVTATYKHARALHDRIAVYGEAVTSTDNIAILKRSFDAGQTSLTDFVTDSRYFTEAELRLIDLRQAYTDAVLSLELRSLPR